MCTRKDLVGELRRLVGQPMDELDGVVLALGFGACDGATAQESEAQPAPPDIASLAADDDGAQSACSLPEPEPESELVGESVAELVTACRIRVDNPHKSMHFPGTVNVVASVECNRAVPAINMTINLVRDDQENTRSTATNAGSSSLRGSAAAPA